MSLRFVAGVLWLAKTTRCGPADLPRNGARACMAALLHGQRRTLRRLPGLLWLLLSVAGSWAGSAAAEPLVATTAQQVHQMPPDEGEEHIPVHLVATVTYYEPGYNLLFVSDASGSVFVWATQRYAIHVGDLVEIDGSTQGSLWTEVSGNPRIRVLSSGHRVSPIPAGFEQLMSGKVDCRPVTIHGTVHSANLVVQGTDTIAQIQVMIRGGIVQVYLQDPGGLDVSGLIDAEVTISGVAGAEFNAALQAMRPKLFVSSGSDLKVDLQPRIKPIDLPVTDIAHVMETHFITSGTRRVRVEGAVTAFDPGYSLVIENAGKSLLVLTRQTGLLPLGEVVDVVGFADDHAYSAVLEDAEFYPTGQRQTVVPKPASYAEAISGVDSDALISLTGRVLSELHGEISDTLVIMVDQHPVDLVLRRNGSMTPLPPLQTGTLVRVYGICRVTAGLDWNRQPLLFRLDLRDSNDLHVIAKPSWWNVRHLLGVGGALLASVLLVLIWVMVLRRRVAEQTEQIERSIRVERERSRLLEQINSETPLDDVLIDICSSMNSLIPGICCVFSLDAQAAECLHRGPDQLPSLIPDLYQAALTDGRGKHAGIFRAQNLKEKQLSTEERDILVAGASLANLAIHQRRMYAELNYHSTHDQLTALPNRRLADARLEEALAYAISTGHRVGVAYIDVDHFKQVNDRYGHKIGDLYLQQIASRLGSKIRSADLLARIGGDEFLLVATALGSLEDGEAYKHRLRDCFRDVFVLDGIRVHGSASIGIAVCPDHGTSSEALKRHADEEMYTAKHHGRGPDESVRHPERGTQVFSPSDLRAALDASQFRLFYQPQFSSDGQFRGLEALVRLDDPILGLVAPDAFIEVAENSDVILPLGAWILRQALTDASRWRLGSHDDARIVVNVSARQIAQPHFAEEVAQALSEAGVPAGILELEITERTAIADFTHAHRQLSLLQSMGVHISIDDFGTAHSSLNALHQLPIDTLKIDRSFVRALDTEPGVMGIVEAIVCMAQALGKRIVAEGIETERDLQVMIRLGEMDFQGYFFSRPVPAEAVAVSLVDWRRGMGVHQDATQSVAAPSHYPAVT